MHSIIDDFTRKCDQYENDYKTSTVMVTRLIARRANSFRHMRGFRDIYKVRSALGRLIRLDFKRTINSLRCALPDVALPDGYKVYLPTRNYYEYVLLRLIAAYKLYERINYLCKDVANFFFGLIYKNHFFDINMLLIAVISKLSHLTKILLDLHAELYNKLQLFRHELPLNRKKLPEQDASQFNLNEYKFPEKLDYCIKNDGGQSTARSKSSTVPSTTQATKCNVCPPQYQLHLAPDKVILNRKERKIDLGTVLERNKNTTKRINDLQQQLQTIEQVKKFIRTENNARKKSPNASVTHCIAESEWQSAVKLFNKRIQNVKTNDRAVRFFRDYINAKLY